MVMEPRIVRVADASGELEPMTERLARQKGFGKLLVETYTHPDFDKARRFYERSGFEQAGRIDDYLSDGSAMIVYAKHLRQAEMETADVVHDEPQYRDQGSRR
jgi:hypothetical protein